MAFSIPNNLGQIRQVNRGDVFGELWETFNIDTTSSPGKLKTSKRMELVLDSGDLSDPTSVVDILIWDSKYVVITEDEMFTCSVLDDPKVPANWSKPGIIEDFDLASTAVVFDGLLRISTNTNIARWNGSVTYANNWWTADISGTALTTGKPHILHVHRGGQETLFVTDGNLVRYYNSTAGHTTITLQSDLTACCIDSGVSAIWVGTFNETSGNAYVYEMYIGDTLPRNAYQVDGQAVLAMWVKDNIPYIVTERGHIQAFNGVGFTTIDSFPFVFSNRPLDGVRPGVIQDRSDSRPIHPRGVKRHNESTFILINTRSNEDEYAATARAHSGVWEFDHTNNTLTHRFGFCDAATDFGAAVHGQSGPLLIVENDDVFAIAGTIVDNLTNEPGLYMVGANDGLSWFVTPEIPSGTIQDTFQRVVHRATLGTNAVVYTLYRTSKRPTVYLTATWLDTTRFTTTGSVTNLAVGDLVRVSHRHAAGNWATIEHIETGSSTATITVNRAIGVAGETSAVYSDNFKLVDEQYTTGEYKPIGIGATAPWIQYMVIMSGSLEYRYFDSIEAAKTQRG